MPQDFATDVSILTGRGKGGLAQFLGTEAWTPDPVYGKIIEHSPHVSAGRLGLGFSGSPTISSPGFGSIAGTVLDFPQKRDFIEFRYPHRKKKQFFDQFLGATGGRARLSREHTSKKAITVRGAGGLFITYGKMKTYQVKLLTGSAARSLVKDGFDAGMQVGDGVVAVITAAGGAGLSAAALSGVTLGAGAAVVAVVIAGTAVKNHAQNLKNKQVFLRISKSPESKNVGAYFPYEEKVYFTGMLQNNSVTYGQIAKFLDY